jgi:ATP-dependent helicase/nuclease subunit A
VPLLTIHGAKGLEAPIVFIVDTDPAPPSADTATLLVDWPVGQDAPERVAFIASGSNPPASMQALQRAEAVANAREELNGLYVAMSRAEEMLVISRTEPMHDGAAPSWWDRLHALAELRFSGAAGAAAHRDELIVVPTLPALLNPAPIVSPKPGALDAPAAALGSAVHRLLEWAARPGSPLRAERRAEAALAAARAFGLDAAQAGDVARLAAQVLSSAECRRFFDPAALAWAGNEVPVVVEGSTGRIDRLVAFDEPPGRVWWVLDYKLDSASGDVEANRAQLAGYVAAVRALQTGDMVRGAFITAGGRLVTVDA